MKRANRSYLSKAGGMKKPKQLIQKHLKKDGYEIVCVGEYIPKLHISTDRMFLMV